ncbi:MAG: hypothetical protein KDE33_25570 [Bacteroidetes bacterium]|nr:hypothetical protein [Bacteroidota bacterium]
MNTIESYEEFILNFPESELIKQATDSIARKEKALLGRKIDILYSAYNLILKARHITLDSIVKVSKDAIDKAETIDEVIELWNKTEEAAAEINSLTDTIIRTHFSQVIKDKQLSGYFSSYAETQNIDLSELNFLDEDLLTAIENRFKITISLSSVEPIDSVR